MLIKQFYFFSLFAIKECQEYSKDYQVYEDGVSSQVWKSRERATTCKSLWSWCIRCVAWLLASTLSIPAKWEANFYFKICCIGGVPFINKIIIHCWLKTLIEVIISYEKNFPKIILEKWKILLTNKNRVEPWYNEPLYNNVLSIMNDFLYLSNIWKWTSL